MCQWNHVITLVCQNNIYVSISVSHYPDDLGMYFAEHKRLYKSMVTRKRHHLSINLSKLKYKESGLNKYGMTS